MAVTGITLATSKPAADTLTKVFTAYRPTKIESIIVCNQDATATTYRIGVANVDAAEPDASQYFIYGLSIAGNKTVVVPLPKYLSTGQSIHVYATLATLAFSFEGEV